MRLLHTVGACYRIARAVYRVALFLWFARRIGRWLTTVVYAPMLRPLLAITRGPREAMEATAFVLKWAALVHHLVPPRLRPALSGDVMIQIQGLRHVVKADANEIDPVLEIYGEHLYDRLEEFIPCPGWVVLDVGANVGVYALRQARRGARVYAFEPNPHSYRRLMRAVTANRLGDRITASNVALGSALDTVTLVIPHGFTTGGTIVGAARTPSGEGEAVRVDVNTLDDVAASLALDHVDMLKIDVEGAELEVLSGAGATLGKVRRIIVEYHSPAILDRLREILRDHGFEEALCLDLPHEEGVGLLYAARADTRLQP